MFTTTRQDSAMSSLLNLVIAMCASIACTPATAALVDLHNGTVKDEATNLVWLKDWDQLGSHNWFDHNATIDSLDFAGSSDWRLPTVDEYLALWAQVGSTTSGLQAHFDDVQSTSVNDIHLFHWSSEPAPASPFFGYYFTFRRGLSGQGEFGVRSTLDGILDSTYATAVRVAGNDRTVPEPQTLLLVLAALSAACLPRRRSA